MQEITATKSSAPKVGLLINSIGAFNPAEKDRGEQALRDYFGRLAASGAIHPDSLVRGRIFGPHEAAAAADEFAAALVDLVLIGNIAFPNGHVFVTLATHPHLAKIPMAVLAEPEPEGSEWATNAWCGAIMNNFAARQIGRPIAAVPGRFGSNEFDTELGRVLRAARTVKMLRSEFVGRFGEAPGGFHSASGNQLAFAATFGTRVDTIDLTAVIDAYRTGATSGYLGRESFTDDDVRRTVDELAQGREIRVDDDMLERGARLYHAFRAIIRANGYTSAAFRCWPETNEPYIGISQCVAMGLLLTNGDITAAACESDWPTAVAQTMGTALSGRPAACLDWVNYTGGSETIQLGHCGMGLCGAMEDGCIGVHPVIRQAGGHMGPVYMGQFEYGPKTGICLMQAPDSRFKLLTFTGESSPETAKGLLNSAADISVPDYRRLNRLVLEHGFPHHLAVAFGDITEELRLICRYLDIDYISPHD